MHINILIRLHILNSTKSIDCLFGANGGYICGCKYFTLIYLQMPCTRKYKSVISLCLILLVAFTSIIYYNFVNKYKEIIIYYVSFYLYHTHKLYLHTTHE